MTTFANNFLATELAFFKENRDEWCKTARGKHVVVAGKKKIGGFYTSFDQAMSAAYSAGLNEGEFLVDVVMPSDSAEWVSHVSPGAG